MTTHDEQLRQSLGGYALGALEPTEQQDVERHLADCAACRAELSELRSVLPALARLRPADLSPAAPSPQLFDRITDAVDAREHAARPPRSRRALLAVAASAVVLAAAGTAIGVTVSSSSPARPAATVASATTSGVSLRVSASDASGGTRLELQVSGLPRHERCHLVALAADGSRHDAGRWDADYGGVARVVERTDVTRAQLRGLRLYGRDGRELVRVAL